MNLMARFTMETLKRTIVMGMVQFTTLMEGCFKVSGAMARRTEGAFTLGQTVRPTKSAMQKVSSKTGDISTAIT
jgi:hypothetical protein